MEPTYIVDRDYYQQEHPRLQARLQWSIAKIMIPHHCESLSPVVYLVQTQVPLIPSSTQKRQAFLVNHVFSTPLNFKICPSPQSRYCVLSVLPHHTPSLESLDSKCYNFRRLRQSLTVVVSKVQNQLSLEECKSWTCIVLLGLRAKVQVKGLSIKDQLKNNLQDCPLYILHQCGSAMSMAML